MAAPVGPAGAVGTVDGRMAAGGCRADRRRTNPTGFKRGRHAGRDMALFERPKPQMGTQGDVVPRRVGAFVVDLLVLGLVAALVSAALGLDLLAGGGIGTAFYLLYFIVFEGTYGKTPGKHLLGLVVVTERGNACGYEEAVIRTVLRLIDGLPGVLYIVGIVTIFLTDEKQRLGDLAADTVVVRAAKRGEQL
jgi:uncharacterized RDD family membrane protein YckC